MKRMEELGIGRPSTYASIISVLQNREYVRLEQKRFVPEDRGRLVNAFLTSFFDRYIQADFTAQLEDKLDGVAAGEMFWKDVLRDFWVPFAETLAEVGELRVAQVIDALNERSGPAALPAARRRLRPARVPGLRQRALSLKIGRFGAFVGCSNYPECRFTRQLGQDARRRSRPRTSACSAPTRPTTSRSWRRTAASAPMSSAAKGRTPSAARCRPGLASTGIDLETALRLLAPAARGGPRPRDQRADPGRHRPLRALRPARQAVRRTCRPTRTC